ncbi:putative ribonuclease P protein subunit 3 [Golovinomyces cichoracearum]|uniref:Putative ribonuclease P protein subunit 3 n=1 Tax=Golovinomyces cichoracearum TaxID=62708 RepID=A0A420ING4_9PEZI|nr:putative ribonuclease P protein subunit 3 [Golovinomyces cichoracearum]
MIYDLNIAWTSNKSQSSTASLERTINFLSSDLGYQTIALTCMQSEENLTKQLVNQIPEPNNLPFKPTSSKVTILRRCTLIYTDPSKNHRLPALAPLYDILALRPTNERAFLAACLTVSEHSIISLDLTIRYPFHFKPKTLMTAVNRGIHIEICYGQCLSADSVGRRNFISNTQSLIRCTKGRGLIVSSEAANVLMCRGSPDLVNLLEVWGLSRERAMEAIGKNPRHVVVNEGIKRTGFRGVIDVVDGGQALISPRNDAVVRVKGKRVLDQLHENDDHNCGYSPLSTIIKAKKRPRNEKVTADC